MAGHVHSKKKCVQMGTKSCQKIVKIPHTVVYACGTWMCSVRGASFKKAGRHGVAVVGGRTSCMGKYRIWEATHGSRCIHTAELEGGTCILFCSLWGAYGVHRAVRLKERCQPQDKAKRLAQWSAIVVKQMHPVSKAKLTGIRRARVIGQPPAVVQWVASDHEQTAAPGTEKGHHGKESVAGHQAELQVTSNHAHRESVPTPCEEGAGPCPPARVVHGDDEEWTREDQ